MKSSSHFLQTKVSKVIEKVLKYKVFTSSECNLLELWGFCSLHLPPSLPLFRCNSTSLLPGAAVVTNLTEDVMNIRRLANGKCNREIVPRINWKNLNIFRDLNFRFCLYGDLDVIFDWRLWLQWWWPSDSQCLFSTKRVLMGKFKWRMWSSYKMLIRR